MTDEPRNRLAAAAESAREHANLTARLAELNHRFDRMNAELATLEAALVAERSDVAKLEGVSITRALAAIAGRRGERLDKERAEAEAAAMRVVEAEGRIAAVRAEIDALRDRLRRLGDAPAAFRALMVETERAIIAAGEPGGAELAAMAAECGQLRADRREADEALAAARHAQGALGAAAQALASASSWSTYDTFFGGGAIASAVKHDRLDGAWAAAANAERYLAALRTELADVRGMPPLTVQLRVSTTSRMIDIWFDNVFTDLAIRDKIRNSQASVQEARGIVHGVEVRLAERIAGIDGRLRQLDAARRTALLGE